MQNANAAETANREKSAFQDSGNSCKLRGPVAISTPLQQADEGNQGWIVAGGSAQLARQVSVCVDVSAAAGLRP
jgi:hypothetical protein